ncbi:MAG: hypothetical protein ACPGEF_03785 [Endozoicomonas sp.]
MSCLLVCVISMTYLVMPIGFGGIFLNSIMLPAVNEVAEQYGFNVAQR